MLMFMVNLSTLIAELCAIKCVYTHIYKAIKCRATQCLFIYRFIHITDEYDVRTHP